MANFGLPVRHAWLLLLIQHANSLYSFMPPSTRLLRRRCAVSVLVQSVSRSIIPALITSQVRSCMSSTGRQAALSSVCRGADSHLIISSRSLASSFCHGDDDGDCERLTTPGRRRVTISLSPVKGKTVAAKIVASISGNKLTCCNIAAFCHCPACLYEWRRYDPLALRQKTVSHIVAECPLQNGRRWMAGRPLHSANIQTSIQLALRGRQPHPDIPSVDGHSDIARCALPLR